MIFIVIYLIIGLMIGLVSNVLLFYGISTHAVRNKASIIPVFLLLTSMTTLSWPVVLWKYLND